MEIFGFFILVVFTLWISAFALLCCWMTLPEYNIGGVENPIGEKIAVLSFCVALLIWWYYLLFELSPFSVTINGHQKETIEDQQYPPIDYKIK